MITAKDINTRRFEQAKPGYKPEEVDEFLKEIADQINAMLKDKEDIESIRRYKADEEALKDAMIGAQKQGRAVIEEAKGKAETIVAEAQQKAEQIISAANVKADEIVGTTAIRAQREKAELEKMQNAVIDFKSRLLTMYKSHLELITALPENDEPVEEEAPAPAPQPAEAEDMEATRVIDTSSVQ